jgi:heme oxygenase
MTVITDEKGFQTSFSAMLKEASWGAHERAAQAPFMAQLIGGDLALERYADLVVQMYFAYRALEGAADALDDDPVAGPFVTDRLTRLPALEADLAHLLGPDWASTIEPLPATSAYVDRLHEVCFTWPGGFVGHHYVRYLGDLSGGQYIGKVVARTYGLDGDGVQFFRFEAIDDLAGFKDDYRDLLDAAPWDLDEKRRIIDEILLAYQLNTDVLDALS